jgi:DNA-binding PadR family transcriptional regulator
MSPSALTVELLVTSGTMTNRIDRLVTAGWVSRQRDPADRRGILVGLTEQGRQKVDDALADFLRLEAQMRRALDEAECTTLTDSLRHLVASVEAADPLHPDEDDAEAAAGDPVESPESPAGESVARTRAARIADQAAASRASDLPDSA